MKIGILFYYMFNMYTLEKKTQTYARICKLRKIRNCICVKLHKLRMENV